MDTFTIRAGNKARVGVMEKPVDGRQDDTDPLVFIEWDGDLRIQMSPEAAKRVAKRLTSYARVASA